MNFNSKALRIKDSNGDQRAVISRTALDGVAMCEQQHRRCQLCKGILLKLQLSGYDTLRVVRLSLGGRVGGSTSLNKFSFQCYFSKFSQKKVTASSSGDKIVTPPNFG